MSAIFVLKLMFPYHSHQHVRKLSSDAYTQFLVKFIDSRSQHVVLPHADLVLCIWHNIILGTWIRAIVTVQGTFFAGAHIKAREVVFFKK